MTMTSLKDVEGRGEMQILAFNGSPRKKGNTSAMIRAILSGAESEGAETVEVRLHDLDMKRLPGMPCLPAEARSVRPEGRVESLSRDDEDLSGHRAGLPDLHVSDLRPDEALRRQVLLPLREP